MQAGRNVSMASGGGGRQRMAGLVGIFASNIVGVWSGYWWLQGASDFKEIFLDFDIKLSVLTVAALNFSSAPLVASVAALAVFSASESFRSKLLLAWGILVLASGASVAFAPLFSLIGLIGSTPRVP